MKNKPAPTYQETMDLVRDAYTRPEVEAAQEAISASTKAYPNTWPHDALHGWGYTHGALEERERQGQSAGMTEAEMLQRDEFLKTVRPNSIRALDSKEETETLYRFQMRLSEYLKQHPGDPFAIAFYNQLEQTRKTWEMYG